MRHDAVVGGPCCTMGTPSLPVRWTCPPPRLLGRLQHAPVRVCLSHQGLPCVRPCRAQVRCQSCETAHAFITSWPRTTVLRPAGAAPAHTAWRTQGRPCGAGHSGDGWQSPFCGCGHRPAHGHRQDQVSAPGTGAHTAVCLHVCLQPAVQATQLPRAARRAAGGLVGPDACARHGALAEGMTPLHCKLDDVSTSNQQ